ncbi:NB-ARC domain-containing protein [Dictyobacter kobayashii]|uniref:Uncharacterized protein n=1 Tax=Dictyobacter kobayashii TaxID=2014872 RepID=A0A402AYC8_9CHLR|nr:NB-ARC domain-containing protein [Dictyobacter kobayashii]GCE24109.1 hypothetical protein KDK_79090 [Dictyobacter kobayashii]
MGRAGAATQYSVPVEPLGALLAPLTGENTVAPGIDSWALALRSAIGSRRMLIVIDDAWDIEAALPFKVGGANCAFLLTTRFPRIALQFAGEAAQVVRELSTTDGVQLLTHLAPEIVVHDKSAALELVRAVGGLPLALTLMGKYLQTQAYANQPRRMRTAITRLQDASLRLRLHEPQAPLERSPSLMADTALSLQSTIAVSDRVLSEEARTTLRALAVFPAKPNSFSEEAAIAVAHIHEDILDELADAGLLESSGPGRYTLHQTIADFARANQQDNTASERLIAYMIRYVEKQQANYEALERESSNILAALALAFEFGQQARMVRGVNAFAPFLLQRGLYDQARIHLQRAHHHALWQRDSAGIALTLYFLGNVALQQADYSQAESHLRDGLAEAQNYGHTAIVARLQQSLAELSRRQNDKQQSAGTDK